MDFIRRAWLFNKSKISRTILLIIAFTAILVFILSGLIINSAANHSIEDAKKSAGATVTLSINRQAVMEQSRTKAQSSDSGSTKPSAIEMPTISKSDADKIAKLEGIKSYSYTKQATADANTGITAISTTSSTEDSQAAPQGNMGDFGGPAANNMSSGDFQVIGTNNLAASSDFSQGTNSITSGRAIQASDEGSNNVVIEESLATENNLKVNSTFTIKDSNNKTYKMTVVGIYKSESNDNGLSSNFNFMNPANQIYTALSVPNAIENTKDTLSSASFDLENPAEANNFVKEATQLIDTNKFEVQSNDALYQQMLQPLNNISNFAKNIVILVAIAGAIILGLIVMLMVRERRYEIGVLMSLGESKGKIVAQFFTELLMIMLVSVGIATASGNIVGNAIGQQLLKQETQVSQANNQKGPGENSALDKTPENKNENIAPGGMQFGQKNQQAINKLEVKMSAQQLGILVAIALSITLIAVGLAAVGILRLNPKQVLTN